MIPLPPLSTRTDSLCPYTTLCRSRRDCRRVAGVVGLVRLRPCVLHCAGLPVPVLPAAPSPGRVAARAGALGARADCDPLPCVDGRRPGKRHGGEAVRLCRTLAGAVPADPGLADHPGGAVPPSLPDLRQIGRASWWERWGQYVSVSVVSVALKKKKES